MIARLKKWLRRKVVDEKEEAILAEATRMLRDGRILTPEQKTLLDADRRTVLRAMLSAEQWQLVAALEAPLQLKDEERFTQADVDGLEQFFRSPLGLKMDAAMNNWLIGTAQSALGAPSAELVAHAKFAWGCRAGWEMTKTISRLAAADSGAEGSATTGAPDLDHLTP